MWLVSAHLATSAAAASQTQHRPRAMLAQPRRRSTDDAAVAACQDARLSRLRTAALSLRCAARHHAWRDGDAAHAWPAGCATPGSTVQHCQDMSNAQSQPLSSRAPVLAPNAPAVTLHARGAAVVLHQGAFASLVPHVGSFGAGANLSARARSRSGSRLRRPLAACAVSRGAPRSRAQTAQRRRRATRRRRSLRPHCPHSAAAPTAAPSLLRAPSSAALASVRRTSARTWCSATARTLLCPRAALPHGPS